LGDSLSSLADVLAPSLVFHEGDDAVGVARAVEIVALLAVRRESFDRREPFDVELGAERLVGVVVAVDRAELRLVSHVFLQRLGGARKLGREFLAVSAPRGVVLDEPVDVILGVGDSLVEVFRIELDDVAEVFEQPVGLRRRRGAHQRDYRDAKGTRAGHRA
jgi:hypothetical protein